MIKLIIYCTKIIVAIIVATLFASCLNINNGIDGNGNVKTETRDISETFTKIEVNRGIEVIVEQGEGVTVEVEADENLIKHITTTVKNGTLKISTNTDIDSAEKELVRVKLPIIESLISTAGSSIFSQNTLKGNTLFVESESGSENELALEYDKVESKSSSGSSTKLSGKALKLKTDSSSGSEINAGTLLANEIYAESSSGSTTMVHALVILTAKASSGSSIEYNGKPKKIAKEENSGGSISEN